MKKTKFNVNDHIDIKFILLNILKLITICIIFYFTYGVFLILGIAPKDYNFKILCGLIIIGSIMTLLKNYKK
jgi:hypothetical protein